MSDEFGFKKNLSKEAYPIIDYYIMKRKREGRDTTVSVDGRPVKRRNLQKAISRYRIVGTGIGTGKYRLNGSSLHYLRYKESAPKLPQGVILHTPPCSPLLHQPALVSPYSKSLATRIDLTSDSLCTVSFNSDPVSLSMALEDTISEYNVNSFDNITTHPSFDSFGDMIMDHSLNSFEDMILNPNFETFQDTSK
jgi:hypothetical protein